MDNDFKFDLLENGLDYMLSGLNYIARQKDKSDIKYGILHLCSGLELILKEKLRREDFSLIFHNIDDADLALINSGEFKSVDFKECIQRLKSHCQVNFKGGNEQHLLNFRSKRNRLEHFGINDSCEGIISASIKVVEIIIDFIGKELSPGSFSFEEEKTLTNIRKKLSDFSDFVDEHMEGIQKELDNAELDGCYLIECPECYQETLMLGNDINFNDCAFCKFGLDPESMVERWIGSILNKNRYMTFKDGGEYPLYPCPECHRETLIEENNFVCFACGNFWKRESLDNCMSCNQLYILRDDGPPFCSDCIDYMISKN